MEKEKKLVKISAVIAAIMFLVMISLNGMANALPLNGVNTGQLSDEIPNLFVPAGPHLRHMGPHLPTTLRLYRCNNSRRIPQGRCSRLDRSRWMDILP
ncbi:hypothetical protein MASR2M48_21960 [Spirochaetota bacterium]